MKKFKRLLSAVLVLSIVLASLPVFAYNDIPAEDIIDYIFRFDVGEFAGGAVSSTGEADPDTERIKFLETIGLWDDASIPKDMLLTMTEFAVIMSKVKLGSENAVKEVYLNNPDTDNATYKLALECLLYATGYNYRLAEFGGGDKAVVIVASDLGLIPSNPENINAFITRGELAKLIAKAITIDICTMEYTQSGGYRYTVAKGKNILNTVHNIYDISGFVNAVPGFAVYGGASLKKGYIQIDRANINAAGLDLSKYFGKHVTAYGLFDDVLKEYSVVYIAEDMDSVSVEIDFNNIVSCNRNEIVYVDEENTERELTTGDVKTVIENGKKINSLSEMSDFKDSEGKIVFASSAKNDVLDIAIIYKYNYYIVDYVDTTQVRIGIKNGQTYKGKNYIQLDDKGINSVSIYGVEAGYKDIPVNSAIRVLECNETNYFQIAVSSERQKGEIAYLYDDILEVAGKTYRISKDLLNYIEYCDVNNITGSDKAVLPELGNVYTFYILNEIIVGISMSEDAYSFGFLKSASESRTSIDPEMTLRVFTDDGEWKNFSLADRVELEGKAGMSKTDVSDFIKSNAGEVIGNLIRYKSNSTDKIISLYTAKDTGTDEYNADDVNLVDSLTVEVDWTKWFINGSSYLFNPAAKVFVIPTNRSRESDYKLLNPSVFENGMVYELSLYNPDDFRQVGAVVYNGDMSDATVQSNTPTFFYVENMRKVVIDKDELIFGYRVMGMEGVRGSGKGTGTFEPFSYYIDEEKYNKRVADGTAFQVGDFMKIDVLGNELIDWEVSMRGGDPYFESGVFERLEDGTDLTEKPDKYYICEYETNTVNSYELVVGKIAKIDYAEFLLLIDCGNSGFRTVGTRILGSVDKGKNKLNNLSISDFHVDDEVLVITGGPNAHTTLKTVN